jgi:hypothetical protein
MQKYINLQKNNSLIETKILQDIINNSTMALPFAFKKYLKAKEELWKHSNIISPCKNILIFKKKQFSNRNQNPSRYYYNPITNLKFRHKPKYHLPKILT